MSSDQPGPGSGEPPQDDPFLKKPGEREPRPPAGAPAAGSPYGGSPYGGGTDPAGPAGGGPYGGGGPGGGPYADNHNPYGGGYGMPDPLAGMPPLAGRGRRLLARIIDSFIICVTVGWFMTFLVGGVDYTSTDSAQAARQAMVSGITMLAYLVYEGLMLTSRGQTLGKMLMKIRVAMLADGAVPTGQAGWTRAAVYTLPEIVPCCGFVFWLVNVLWCTWDKPYQQCLHDKAVKTVVVSTA
ncbi:RDD family protein [Streptomyces sp. MST-110588]|uniref:RDD family protein n=1 Tax=Streptomyces sp. MST-110588 TaxID=2833628 RepID=UPI001F5C8BC2|nr:RDD family protein [Streptomyces sp. MST-110588]UNO41806.1 RDD family protein [Streptomyces sp. MST-110588]